MSILSLQAELAEAMQDFVYACHRMKLSAKRSVFHKHAHDHCRGEPSVSSLMMSSLGQQNQIELTLTIWTCRLHWLKQRS